MRTHAQRSQRKIGDSKMNRSFFSKAVIGIFLFAGCSSSDNPTVEPTPTPAAPQVESKIPGSGATNVATNTNVSAVFDVAMDPTTLDDSTFFPTVSGTPVAGAVTYSAAQKMVTFNPTSDFGTSETVTVHATTGVKSLDGTPLANELTWSFTTGAGPDDCDPTFSNISSITDNEDATATLHWTAATDGGPSCGAGGTPASSIVYRIHQTINCSGTVSASVTGKTSYTSPALTPGSHSFCVQAVDSAGNVSSSTSGMSKAITVKWSTMYANWFATGKVNSCQGSSCHSTGSGKPDLSNPLDMSSASTGFGDLVGVTAFETGDLGSLKRVHPGDPDNSYLYWKLAGTAHIQSGTVQMPKSKTKLTSDNLAAIRYWILAGAQNN